MNAEDEYLAELIKRDNEISYFKQQLEKTSGELERTSGELERTSGELEKEKILRKENDKMIIDLAKTMKENNISVEVIIEKTKLSKQEIDKL